MKPQYHYDIEQGTALWHSLRAGKVGGSIAHTLTVLPTKKEQEAGEVLSKGSKTLAYKVAAGVMELDIDAPDPFQTDAMERGNILEPYARKAYNKQAKSEAIEVGYISRGKYMGYSPDGANGIVGTDGLLEIKCPMGHEYCRIIDTEIIDPKHISQMQWGMFVSGRAWCDYFVFHDMAATHFLKRVERCEETMQRFEVAYHALEEIVERVLSKVESF